MTGYRRESFGPGGYENILIVTDPAFIRVVTDPVRLRIFDLTRDRPRTVKELAAALDVPVTRLYHHVNLLERHGVIAVASTRQVSGITEKTYTATASRISIDRALFAPDAPSIDAGANAFVTVVLDGAKAEIRRGIATGRIDPADRDPGAGGLTLGRIWMRLTPDRLAEFQRRLGELETEFGLGEDATADPAATAYEWVIGVYPIDGAERKRPGGDGADG